MVEYIADKIKTADLVLVGLGEELDAVTSIKQESEYQKISSSLRESWKFPFVEKVLCERYYDDKIHTYRKLAQCLDGKNYFVVSLCQDGFIKESDLDMQRVVEPCGGYEKLQCSEKCCTELYDVPTELLEEVRQYMAGGREIDDNNEPVCPHCSRSLMFNNVNIDNYIEEVYLEKWLLYKKWLQGTINRNVCILEIGVGMKYPTVIRWPFEKVSFYNQKADFFRIHSKFYQIPAEMKEKGHGICHGAEEFIVELSQYF